MWFRFALLTVLFFGCGDWDDSWPLPVVPSNMAAEDEALLQEAVDEWSSALTTELGEPTTPFELNASHDEHYYVEVSSTNVDIAGDPDTAGRTGRFKGRGKAWAEIIYRADLPKEVRRAMFTHELGHVLLGPNHSPDPHSILFSEYQPDAHVSPADARAVQEHYGL